MKTTRNNLSLMLKSIWYDMYLSGKKKEEYRNCNAFWLPRLFNVRASPTSEPRKMTKDEALTLACNTAAVKAAIRNGNLVPIRYDTVTFHRGYTKETLVFETAGLPHIGVGKPEWGAPQEEVIIIPTGIKRITND